MRFIYQPYSFNARPKITIWDDVENKVVIEGHQAYELHTELMQLPPEDRQMFLSVRFSERFVYPSEPIDESYKDLIESQNQ